MTVFFGTSGEIDRHGIEYGRDHLAGHGPFPDKGIEPELVVLEHAFEIVGMPRYRGGANRLVGLLRVLRFGLELARLVGNVLFAVALCDDVAYLANRDFCERHRVGAHVGYQADIALSGEFDALVKPLRSAHGSLSVEAELARGFLLQRGAFVGNQPGCERLPVLAQVGLDGPVLACPERLDLEFALDDHSQGRALHAPCGQAGLDLLPQQWR